jgi:selenocysteine lyase/cysteine desulfurase
MDTTTDTSFEHIRPQFPGLDHVTYLDTSSCGLLARSTAEAARQEQELLMDQGSARFGYWMNEGFARIRDRVGKNLNVAGDDIALITCWSSGIAQLAPLLAARPQVLLVAEDYPTLHAPFQRGGFRPSILPTRPDGTLSMDLLRSTMERERPQVVAISHVQWKTGFRVDLAAIAALCKEHGAWSVVDVTQSWGSVPLDLGTLGLDIVGASAYKWPLAGFGSGFMYVAPELREAIERTTHVDPIQLLSAGHRDPVAMVRLHDALERMDAIGLDAIAERVNALCDHGIARFDAAGITVLNGRAPDQRGGILMIAGDEALASRLLHKKVQVAQRGAGIRVGIHYYNTKHDIDRLVDAIV